MTDELTRTSIRSGAPWEPIVGYSRAVRAGNTIAVTGCASVDENGQLVGEGDPYLQAQQCIRVIRTAVEGAGAALTDVEIEADAIVL